ncbi:hypothetical protein TSUD_257630 [Trifolium subterraneum]|uniref:peptidylprolyl isomerase n=1 Tax=Trifolium subterraneum TaxID=3900 RepID=A0A2Z6N0Y8_TRISU|nr:hypothetical protein TSUD_257630 [Trifolium subterraneum]
MELCTRTFKTSLFFNPSFSLSSSNSHLLRFNTTLKPFKFSSINLSSFIQPSIYHHTSSSPFTISASSSSSSVELYSENDRLPAKLKVSETPESNSRVRLHVEVPPLVCEDCYQRVLVEFTKHAKIPGFRPGKTVPESILLGYVGIQNVQKAVIEAILRRTLSHAVTTVTGRALQDSVRIVTKFSEMEETYSSHGLLRYEVIVDVAPEIKWISDDAYKNLKVVVEIDSEIDAHIASEKEFRRRYKSAGVLKVVTDRGLQVGDVVVLDISATTIDQDESNVKSIPSAESKGFNFDTDDSEILVPGFLDSIIGIGRGETKSFPIVFPETWKQENLCGVHAQFTVKELLLQRFQEIEQTAREQATDNAILDHVSKLVEVDIPQSLFEEQGRQLYGSSLLEMQTKIKLNEQQLATLSSPKAVNEYLEHHRENIKNLIKQNLAVGDIYRRENLQLPTEDIVQEVENSIAEFKRQKQEYDEERVKEQVQEILEGAKVLEWLKEHADIQYITR